MGCGCGGSKKPSPMAEPGHVWNGPKAKRAEAKVAAPAPPKK